MTSSISQVGGLKNIVHACLESAAAEKGLPDPVLCQLASLADSIAAGELDPSDRVQMERRVERVINEFDRG